MESKAKLRRLMKIYVNSTREQRPASLRSEIAKMDEEFKKSQRQPSGR
jgi:hypothetical protein